MSVKTIRNSTNKKLGNCAATYRAGNLRQYSTCPSSCPLLPVSEGGADTIDVEYFLAVHKAVPRGGQSWVYTHFTPSSLPDYNPEVGTVINFSTDSLQEAATMARSGKPTVVTLPEQYKVVKNSVFDGIRIVQCPAEYLDQVTCETCGGKQALCARRDRDYVIAFTAHGSSKKLVGTGTGGCYGSSGPVAIHWKKTLTQAQTESDAQVLEDFVQTLPRGKRLRHHVVGDFGE